MSEAKKELKKLSEPIKKKVKEIYGSIDKLYATIYLIARNEHQCRMASIPGAMQRLKTINVYQGVIRFMLDEGGLDGKEVMDSIASDYLDDFIQYKEQDFGMTNEEFLAIIKALI
ncbi:hypothetical protein LJC21_00385 [Bacteroides sp. OttesenSCG-928-E20]|nr:hypothetical protein [Bacteroides sp. OttesenSCG-928-N06]MDL2299150.1 hypothetical protein [Bacteroides sp. OttesenSCG-928-E20]MDL2305804.1 hypothetical protein [Bacteroides sp. OttesenSCG-928-D19]